jgi:hypothetical protein
MWSDFSTWRQATDDDPSNSLGFDHASEIENQIVSLGQNVPRGVPHALGIVNDL